MMDFARWYESVEESHEDILLDSSSQNFASSSSDEVELILQLGSNVFYVAVFASVCYFGWKQLKPYFWHALIFARFIVTALLAVAFVVCVHACFRETEKRLDRPLDFTTLVRLSKVLYEEGITLWRNKLYYYAESMYRIVDYFVLDYFKRAYFAL